jgi:MFS family permease
MGALCDITNRKWMLSITFLIAGATALVCGSVDSFGIFVAMRIIHAIVNSSINPLTYTFISEMVPQNKRNSINSLMGATSFIGIAVSSLAIITIKEKGWRFSFLLIGILSIPIAFLSSIIIKTIPA